MSGIVQAGQRDHRPYAHPRRGRHAGTRHQRLGFGLRPHRTHQTGPDRLTTTIFAGDRNGLVYEPGNVDAHYPSPDERDYHPACPEDVDLPVRWREEASQWLAQQGTDQWREPWPNHEAIVERMLASIEAGKAWMVYQDGQPIAPLALDAWADPNLWTPAEPARYLHRLVVTRSHGGCGLSAAILHWASDRAAHDGALWVRIDVWSNNQALQRYYHDHGFIPIRTLIPTDYLGYPSGALYQRPTRLSEGSTRIGDPPLRFPQDDVLISARGDGVSRGTSHGRSSIE